MPQICRIFLFCQVPKAEMGNENESEFFIPLFIPLFHSGFTRTGNEGNEGNEILRKGFEKK
jgi:hypothetical protein